MHTDNKVSLITSNAEAGTTAAVGSQHKKSRPTTEL